MANHRYTVTAQIEFTLNSDNMGDAINESSLVLDLIRDATSWAMVVTSLDIRGTEGEDDV